ncbi:MAG: CarD family transcriptional regulator [Clostridiales bacterium]|nr:CarD family transcriptional regulator [Clostridiales bacterium]
MFAIGDMIIYGSMGVCRVENIELRRLPKSAEEQSFYVLKPIYQTCSVSTPVDNDKVFMRPVISREEAERLIDTIPAIHAEAYNNSVLRRLSEHYETIIKHYDCGELIELTMSIYAKKRTCEEEKRKFGAMDERYMKRAEDMLFGELAVALGIERHEVQSYIMERIG